jgi:hypothetical protein
MLDHTENRRLHDLLSEIAPLLPAPDEPGCPPFAADKLRRILDRVGDRLADEAAEPAAPRLRELIAEALAHPEAACPAFDRGKVQRILDRVQARLAAEEVPAAARAEAAPCTGHKATTRATLRAVAAAFFMPRRASFGARLLSDDPDERA